MELSPRTHRRSRVRRVKRSNAVELEEQLKGQSPHRLGSESRLRITTGLGRAFPLAL